MTNDHGCVAYARLAHRTFRNPHSAIPNWQGLIGVSLLVMCFFSCARPPVRPVTLGSAEVGMASWYGPEFHGRRTSSGEIYDMYQLTCAHNTLPLGTTVMVTNLENGKSLELKVNDRGPFAKGRIIDLYNIITGASYSSVSSVGSGTKELPLLLRR